ncbi:NAD(P)/FAD-dependent oxidoreductase, partial [Pseudomonas aeruginosa]|nr:NAD(P)/FAD-dependent oxidoreductase [Pseudomonas aeruginosa]
HESRMLAFATFPALMKVMRLSFHRHLHRQIADPQLRARLVPDYPLGCKRILISNDYYPALARSNVELVDTGIREVTEDAVVGRDGRRHEVDAIIFGTGFAATEFLAPMRILGLDGRDLRQAWADGAEAYKGISVSGFPNLFILYGPNTNLGHNSIVYMLESQFPYVLGCLRQLQEQGLRYLDVKPEVQRRFNLEVQQGLRHTVWERGCDSWYKTAAGKNTNNWPGYTFVYRWRTRRPELADYDLAR